MLQVRAKQIASPHILPINAVSADMTSRKSSFPHWQNHPPPPCLACILHPIPASRGSEITRETEHLQSNWPGHHLFESAQRMLERTSYATCQIVCSMLSHWCAARHVEDSQRCSHSQALIQSRCLQLPARIVAVYHVKGDGDHYQQAADEPPGLP